MNRRNFIKNTTIGSSIAMIPIEKIIYNNTPKNNFNLNYAPHFGMFKHSAGEDLIGQLNFIADQGFTAFEDNNLKKRNVSDHFAIFFSHSVFGDKSTTSFSS